MPQAALSPAPAPLLLEASHRQALFTAGQGDYAVYRVPTLIATNRGTLLATTEARKNRNSDWHETHVVMRRSSDGGATWDAPMVINDQHPSDLRSTVRGVEPGTEFSGGLVHGNAVLIPGSQDTVHLIYCVEYHRVFHRISTDDGKTWNTAREITAAFDPLRKRYPFKVCATGPGHGIRRADGTLVLPVWLSLGSGGHGHRPSVVCTLHGDNDGAQWHVEDLVAVDGDHAADGRRVINPNESAVVLLPDERVLISMRTESEANRRLHAISRDGGAHFEHPCFIDDLFDAVCQASVIRHGNALLFSAPDPRDGQGEGDLGWGHARTRRRLILAHSVDGLSWRRIGVISAGSAGYSNLASHGGRVWCIFEDAARDPLHGYDTGALTFGALDLPVLADVAPGIEHAHL